jgi:hypothetical protein
VLNKHNNKVCFVTFYYPGAKKYLKRFSKCVTFQSYKKFDVILICNKIDINTSVIKINQNIKKFLIKGDVNNVRLKTILLLKNLQYENIIFHDIDDYCTPNRVEKLVSLLKSNNVVFNDIHCVKKKIVKKNFFSLFFKNKEKINYKKILNQNFLGFTNTAIKKEVLKSIKLPNYIPKKIIFDWYLWSRVLFNNKAIFTNECVSYYNVSIKSITNLPVKMNNNYTKEVIKIKKIFYSYMKKYNIIYYKKLLKLKIKKKFSMSNINLSLSWWGLDGN